LQELREGVYIIILRKRAATEGKDFLTEFLENDTDQTCNKDGVAFQESHEIRLAPDGLIAPIHGGTLHIIFGGALRSETLKFL
jgi:hypothetical protein